MQIGVYSPFAKERPLFDAVAGTTFYGPRAPVSLSAAADDTFHAWAEGDRLPTVAHRAWGTPLLWWLVCDLNGIVDPFDIATGTVLRLPSRARVELTVLG